MTTKNVIVVENVTKRYLSEKKLSWNEILTDVSLKIKAGEIVALIGKTGCGKTTLLRMICGFEKETAGKIFINGKDKIVPTKNCIMVSQYINQLLPWKTALKNVYAPLLETGVAKNKTEAIKIAEQMLNEVELSKQQNMYPEKLSGGQKQRVAIARALALSPAVLFLDEPFVALDENTRDKLCVLTHDLCKSHKTTTLIVTHSIEEAIKMADRIFVIAGSPATLAAEFIIEKRRCSRLAKKIKNYIK